MKSLLRNVSVVLAFTRCCFAGGQVAWSDDWERAFERAAQEKRVVFLAVNMDGEVANDRMANKVYADAQVVDAASRTVNLVASRFDHAPDGKACTRFDGIECVTHKRIDGAARQNVLKADAQGYVIAPQHVFLAPDRSVILSVPYEITADELAWCFATAIKSVDPESGKTLGNPGHAPRRLVTGAVFDPSAAPGVSLAPPTREQVLELLKDVKAGLWGEGREQKIVRILMSPEPEALEYIAAELKIDWFGRRGFVNGDPGAPDGLGDRQDRLMHSIGVLSPPVYWKIAADYLDHEDEKLRNEAVVALEQLGAHESLKPLLTAASKEKSPAVRKDLMRAIGSAGANDEKARKALLKSAQSDKDELVRRNAIVALGWLAPEAEVNKTLDGLLASGKVEERCAAALAMALSRNDAWLPFLEKARGAGLTPELERCLDSAKRVLGGAALGLLRPNLKEICRDTIQRERFFGRATD